VTARGATTAVNLLADLRDPRFGQHEVHETLVAFDRAGTTIEREQHTPESILSWIDAEFGGTWSSEAWRGGICIARDANGPVGFAAFDPRGLHYAWLAHWRAQRDVGIFGPFGVLPRARKTGVGAALLAFALSSLRERGYAQALIPMVHGERLAAYYEREAGARAVEACDATRGGARLRAAVLASGNGSNFEAVVAASRAAERPLPLDVTTLICNKPGAPVLQRAARLGVAARTLSWDRRTEPRAAYDESVIVALTDDAPDLVLLLGWMHVLPAAFVARFPETLNVHPAFLPLDPGREDVTMPDGTRIPALRGARAVDDAFAAGLAWGGATVHRVAVEVDRGAVIARAPLAIAPGETQDAFAARLHPLEHRVLSTAIRAWSYEQPAPIAQRL
jgi:phosphoribosylglycinamide formyltransferase 1